ncbi:hypothetical protein BPNPMPFG_003355 [Mesorhizobium sp. AR07]|uniref:hypothetical protein n=1 Tax=Mesorhizobium sp. AR07 TaxID=2865838 RepID=UPI002160E326|nr:hypothetical protein [Mesorhizobium sp. AR07]UVK47568.1 hypothetical protein BPNPMPFG_003355 [Mesorhizobium sp. AR07]
MTDFIVTTIDGKQHRGQSEEARLVSLVDQLSSKGHFELLVVSAEVGAPGRETSTVFFKHGIISISESSQPTTEMVAANQPIAG